MVICDDNKVNTLYIIHDILGRCTIKFTVSEIYTIEYFSGARCKCTIEVYFLSTSATTKARISAAGEIRGSSEWYILQMTDTLSFHYKCPK